MFRFTLKQMMVLLVLLLITSCNSTTPTEVEPTENGAEATVVTVSTATPAPTSTLPATATTPPVDNRCDAVSEIPATECQALILFFEATDGPNWQDNSGWLEIATPCSWLGVTCVDNHVDMLALFYNNLQGQLPATLTGLTHLRVLDLHNNVLIGPIPPELGQLTTLEYLDLSANQINGVMPTTFGDLPALQGLNLAYNGLSGAIPAEIGQIATLRNLDLSYNQFNGVLPDSMAELVALESLRLNNNQLEGAIPFGLGELPVLTEVDLSFNRLTGTVPSALFHVAQHRLWGNQLEGTIFAEAGGQQDVNFLGAVFTFDQTIADSVWLELVPARPAEPGPGLVWAPSQHIVFTLTDAAGAQNHAPLGQYLPAEAQIHIYPIAGLNAEVQPVVDGLRQLLAEPPDAAAIEAISLGQDSFLPGLTLLPPSNARQPFRAQVEYLTFVGGRGVRYLTQLSQGPVPVSNQELFYTFQGLTDDGALYVAAYFPVTLPALPDSPQMSDEALTALVEDWLGYLTQTTQLLNESAAAAFTPDLTILDTLINSLSVSGTLDLPAIEGIWPGNEEIVNSQPVLQWQSFPGAINYHVIVLNDGAYPPQVVFDQIVTETTFTVDAPLLPGHYSWTVWAQDEQGTVIAGLTGTFSVKED